MEIDLEGKDNPIHVKFNEFSDEELLRYQSDTTRQIQLIESENAMFETHFRRVTSIKTVDSDKKVVKGSVESTLLSNEQKIEIATRELDEMRDELRKFKASSAATIDDLDAGIEEIDVRISETKNAIFEFSRDVVAEGFIKKGGTIIAEKLIRYNEDKLRIKDGMIEKLRLNNATLKAQQNKIEIQLRQKEEMGGELCTIDFDQLQIENKQYVNNLEGKNNELLRLKLMTARTTNTLNSHTTYLDNLIADVSRLYAEISKREIAIEGIELESKVVEAQKVKMEAQNMDIDQQSKIYRVPEVMDYVTLRSSKAKLQRSVKNWTRKVDIAAMKINQ